MRILIWHVHGSWTTSFVQGAHTYLVPVLPGRGPDGLGRARTWDWPSSVVEVTPEELPATDIDVVVVQRPVELEHLVEAWTGRRPGRDLPAVYLEHNTPEGPVHAMRHPAAGRQGLVVAHVTHFNNLMWDTAATPAVVVEHGIVDPGYRYTGTDRRAAVVVNDPTTRGRVVGADIIERVGRRHPLAIYGMRTEVLGGTDLPQHALHERLGAHRAYLHPFRWTSLGLALLEAMAIGLPPVALATTEVADAVPPGAGIVTNDLGRLETGLERLLGDPDAATAMGERARRAVTARYGLDRFLADWDRLLAEVTR